MATREEIITALAEERARVEQWFHALSAADMQRPVTTSEVEDGGMWTPKDHLAHIIGSERFFQGAIRRALGGAEDPLGFYTQTGSDESQPRRDLINQSNQRAHDKYQDEPAEAFFGRIGETRQATLALLEAMDDAHLAQPIAHNPFGDGTLSSLFLTIAGHPDLHIKWLERAMASSDPSHA